MVSLAPNARREASAVNPPAIKKLRLFSKQNLPRTLSAADHTLPTRDAKTGGNDKADLNTLYGLRIVQVFM